MVLLLLSTVMSRMAQFISRRGPPPTGTFAGQNTGHIVGNQSGWSGAGWSGWSGSVGNQSDWSGAKGASGSVGKPY